MNETDLIKRDIERAAVSYKKSDDGRWAAAFFASRVVNHKPLVIGATKSLASRMGVSPDTVENLAHAYEIYAEFRSDPIYRGFVRQIRKMPYIYYGYFRALYKAKQDYHLTLEQTFSILADMYQAEGTLSQRDLDQHIQDRFGDSRDWTFWGGKAFKEIHKLLQQPDLPAEVRARLIPAYEVLGEKS